MDPSVSAKSVAKTVRSILAKGDQAVVCVVHPHATIKLHLRDILDKVNTVTAIVLGGKNSRVFVFQEQKPPLSKWERTTPIEYESLEVDDLINKFIKKHPGKASAAINTYVNRYLVEFTKRYTPAVNQSRPDGVIYVGSR